MADATIWQFSKKDLVSGKTYDPAWYRVRVESVSEEPSKDGQSTNFWVDGTVLFNADTGDRKFEDHPIRWNFNSKWMAPATGFLIALGTPESELTPENRFNPQAAVGKELDVYIENNLYEGRLNNKVNHKYRPVRTT